MTTTQEIRRYGCFNRPPFADGYWANDGYVDEARLIRKTKWIVHRMTTDCQYSRLKTNADDPGCVGCRHKQEATL